jgi:hypothetical protein
MITIEKMMEFKQPFISAASGLIESHGKFFVVADDENFLAIYDQRTQIGQVSQVFNEILPNEKALRKKNKHDIEALVLLPQQNKLLLVPSGSTPARQRGAIMSQAGQFENEVSFHLLFSQLTKEFSEINIEGGVVIGDELYLFQRGNGPKNQNGIIILNLTAFLSNQKLKLKILPIDLGTHKGINLSFTDATVAGTKILFLAVAEDSNSTYLDGQVVGSVLGMMNPSGEILCTTPLATSSKPEGLCYSSSEKCFYVVTDDDNRDLPSSLFRGYLPEEWNLDLISD